MVSECNKCFRYTHSVNFPTQVFSWEIFISNCKKVNLCPKKEILRFVVSVAMSGKGSLSQEIVILFCVIAALVFAITANAGKEAMFMSMRSLG